MNSESIEGAEAAIFDLIDPATWSARDATHAAAVEEMLVQSFRLQASSIPTYAAYVRHLGVDPKDVAEWRAIPPVPSSAFKSHDLSAAPDSGSGVTFETSGTTISRPGRVRLSSTRLYDASLRSSFRRHVLPDGARMTALVFGPGREETPHSSLWYMVDRIVRELASSATFVIRSGDPDWSAADDTLGKAQRAGEPVLLLGTTLLFMAYFERLRLLERSFSLAPGSRAMDTGGSKGIRADIPRDEVEGAFQRFLGIPASHLVNEYGMAEMGSQFYDDTLLAAHEGREPVPGKHIPPWVRTRVLDPVSMRERHDGGTGILVHYDLANLETPLAIQTEDIGRRIQNRLVLEGRLLGAEARGCSLAFEQFLRQEAPVTAPPRRP